MIINFMIIIIIIASSSSIWKMANEQFKGFK